MQNDVIRGALERRLPAFAVKWVIGKNVAVEPTQIHGVCLISDVAGYTTIAEQLGPKLLSARSNEYFNLLIACIKRYQGEALTIVGDGLTCIWPIEGQRIDRATRLQSCQAGLAMQQALQTFNGRYPKHPFHTRIGLDAGFLSMGDHGGSGRFIYGLAGDVPNTASRIEGLNKYLSTEILASEAVVADLDELLMRPVGRFQLKGKAESINIYHVLNLKEVATTEEFELCKRFSAGLALFAACRWLDAKLSFAELIKLFPDDGPSHFYLQHCENYLECVEVADNDVIKLDVK